VTTERKVFGICFLNADFIRFLNSCIDKFRALDQHGDYKVCHGGYIVLE
jgi:hypothetical protein